MKLNVTLLLLSIASSNFVFADSKNTESKIPTNNKSDIEDTKSVKTLKSISPSSAVISISSNKFIHIYREAEPSEDYFIALSQIVSAEIDKSKSNEEYPYRLTIKTTANSSFDGHSTNLFYQVSYKSRIDAVKTAQSIMESVTN